jgi:hypothetical protein
MSSGRITRENHNLETSRAIRERERAREREREKRRNEKL